MTNMYCPSWTKLKITLNRKTCRVEIMPQPASNEQILYGVFGAVGSMAAIEFYCARRDMRADYARFMKILGAEVKG